MQPLDYGKVVHLASTILLNALKCLYGSKAIVLKIALLLVNIFVVNFADYQQDSLLLWAYSTEKNRHFYFINNSN